MGDVTGISWTDSTLNYWIGCTKVGPGCDHCYAVGVGARSGVEWGAGAPRRLTSINNRNALARYQRKAAAWFAEHGRRRRVFCSSLADIFDNEVPDEWRAEAFAAMEAAPDVLIQICTKRVSNVAKMVPEKWAPVPMSDPNEGGESNWPRNVGVLITTVTPEEILRDVPRLVELKRRFGIPWVGLSIEPMIEDVADALAALGPLLAGVDWLIFGGESGNNARPCKLEWILRGVSAGASLGCAVFVKQLGADCRGLDGGHLILKDAAGKDRAEWPLGSALHTFEFPAALN